MEIFFFFTNATPVTLPITICILINLDAVQGFFFFLSALPKIFAASQPRLNILYL